MNTKSTTNPPTDTDPPSLVSFLRRIASAVEQIAQSLASPRVLDPETCCLTAAQAADVLGVTENWVREHMDDQTIPFTYVGKYRRMRLKHLRAVAEANEIDPSRRGRKTLSRAA